MHLDLEGVVPVRMVHFALGLTTHIAVLLSHSHHDTLVLGHQTVEGNAAEGCRYQQSQLYTCQSPLSMTSKVILLAL